MKKLLFAVLLLTPAFAAAEPASLANRVNVTLKETLKKSLKIWYNIYDGDTSEFKS